MPDVQAHIERWKKEITRLACQATNASEELDEAREENLTNVASLALEGIGAALHRLSDSIEDLQKTQYGEVPR